MSDVLIAGEGAFFIGLSGIDGPNAAECSRRGEGRKRDREGGDGKIAKASEERVGPGRVTPKPRETDKGRSHG